MEIIECIPNISEGRRNDVIEKIIDEIKKVDVNVLDVESDVDHNRTVITYIGTKENIKKATFSLTKKAIELIDMNKHKGQHPRIGAVDVIPFVPLSGITMDECVEFSREFAKEYAEMFKIPVYLYEKSALKEYRRNLANVRRGEFEGLREEIKIDESKKPDFGPSCLHPTAGATAIGARIPLIAYNVYLGTNNLSIAKTIAKAIRERDGGLTNVKALGMEIKEKNVVQVSMNLTNFQKTPIYRVFELIKTEAKRYGVSVIGSEIVGLLPIDAITDSIAYYLQLEKFAKEQILEMKIRNFKEKQNI